MKYVTLTSLYPDLSITCAAITLRPIPSSDLPQVEEMIRNGDLLTPNDTRTRHELSHAARTYVSELKYAWQPKNLTREKWDLPLGLYTAEGELIGRQGVMAKDFLIHREVITYSAVAKHYRGHGYGTLARIAMLAFIFSTDGLGAIHAYSYADDNNEASKRVSEKLGYLYEGTVPHPIDPDLHQQARYHMTTNLWHYRHEDTPVAITGTEPLLNQLGIRKRVTS